MKSTLIAIGVAFVLIGACAATPSQPTPTSSARAPATASPDSAAWPSFAPGPTLTLLPDGVYVHTAAREGLVAAGATGTDVENAGRWTLTVTGLAGTLVLRHDDSNPDETWWIDFTLRGDRVRFQLKDEYFDMRWRLNGNSLDLELVAADTRFGSHSNDAVAYRILDAILGGTWTKAA